MEDIHIYLCFFFFALPPSHPSSLSQIKIVRLMFSFPADHSLFFPPSRPKPSSMKIKTKTRTIVAQLFYVNTTCNKMYIMPIVQNGHVYLYGLPVTQYMAINKKKKSAAHSIRMSRCRNPFLSDPLEITNYALTWVCSLTFHNRFFGT